MYYIGISAGRYTNIMALDEKLEPIGTHVGKTVLRKHVSESTALSNLDSIFTEFHTLTATKPEDCRGICLGGRGVESENMRKSYIDMIETMYECPIRVESEGSILLAAETKGQPGVILFSGMNVLAESIDGGGQVSKTGGFGHLIDDKGSAYWMGMEGIRRSIKGVDGRGAETIMGEKILDYFKVKTWAEVMPIIYNPEFNQIHMAEVANLVLKAGIEKDMVAFAIEEEAVEALVETVRPHFDREGVSSGTLVFGNGFLRLSKSMRAAFISKINRGYPQVKLVNQEKKSELGAAYIAALNNEREIEEED